MQSLVLALALLVQPSRTPAQTASLDGQQPRSAAAAAGATHELAQAEARFRAAIALNPNVAAFHESLALVLERQQQVDDALTEHRAAIQLDSLSARNHAGYGLLLYKLGRTAEALPELRIALALGDSSVVGPLSALTAPKAAPTPVAAPAGPAGRHDVGQFGDDATPGATIRRLIQGLFTIILGVGALALIGPIVGVTLLLLIQPLGMLMKHRATREAN